MPTTIDPVANNSRRSFHLEVPMSPATESAPVAPLDHATSSSSSSPSVQKKSNSPKRKAAENENLEPSIADEDVSKVSKRLSTQHVSAHTAAHSPTKDFNVASSASQETTQIKANNKASSPLKKKLFGSSGSPSKSIKAMTFGVIRRASGSSSMPKSPSSGSLASLPRDSSSDTTRVRASTLPSALKLPSSRDNSIQAATPKDQQLLSPRNQPASRSMDEAKQQQILSALHCPQDYVDLVKHTLEQLIQLMDSVDPKRIQAIRLGSELRGLLGKAQDEIAAYEPTFVELGDSTTSTDPATNQSNHPPQQPQQHHHHQQTQALLHIGVWIAMQNFWASLQPAFEFLGRLHTANKLPVMFLNRLYKKEFMFAFQEINSYYTSVFMELAMAVAKQSAAKALGASQKDLERVVEPPKADDQTTAQLKCNHAHQLFFGHGKNRNVQRAFQLYQEAAQLGNVDAMVCLAHMHEKAIGTELDLVLAETWLSKASSLGSLDASYSLGYLQLTKGHLQQANRAKQTELYYLAMVQFTQAAENGHDEAQFQLGLLHQQGLVGFQDTTRAMHWFAKAADQGHAQAEAAIGEILFCHDKDYVRAMHFFQRAATKSNPTAQMYLGRLFEHGQQVEKDIDRAVGFYRKAVDAGNYEAMNHLASILLTCEADSKLPLEDREKHHDEALRLLLKAAQEGRITEAFYKIGQLLESSRFLRDVSAALRFYCKAANAVPVGPLDLLSTRFKKNDLPLTAPSPFDGRLLVARSRTTRLNKAHVLAAKRGAVMYYSGIGCKKDPHKAFQLYSIAAALDDAESMNALGLMYEEGDGCELNFLQAAACFRQAIDLNENDPHAHFNLACLLSSGKGIDRDRDAANFHFQRALALGYTLAKTFTQDNSCN